MLRLIGAFLVITASVAVYEVSVSALPPAPVISFLAGSSTYPQSFNPAFVEASAGTKGVRGLYVRSQNCSVFMPGQCIHCNPSHGHTDPVFLGSVMSFAKQNEDGSFEPPYLVFAPEPGNANESFGTEDPRIKYDSSTGLYHLFYTCYGGSTITLCHATSTDPTAPYPGVWKRLPTITAGKSAALLIRPSPPHYLYQGDSSITVWQSSDLITFTQTNKSFITVRDEMFDDALVEAGPPPLLLSDGNYIFFHNSANKTQLCYHPGYVIISGKDPNVILQRSAVPLLSPTRDWEIGISPAECNVACVVFLEAAAPTTDGQKDTFDVWFGGSDAVIGTARIQVIVP